jgi:glycosyltransferase involved in cell wall biosynthesis
MRRPRLLPKDIAVSGTSTRALVLLVPGDINLRTGGYGYDREIVAGLRELGWRVDICSLDDSFPFPCADARAQAVRVLAALPDDTLVLADGLAFGAMAAEAEREAARLRFVALVHHPLALESGLDPEAARALKASETRALHAARGVVVTSAATVRSLEPYGIAPGAVAVVQPGTPAAPVASGTRGIAPPHPGAAVELLCVASLTPRKGHDVLLHALSRLTRLQWHLTCAGSPHLHPETAEALASQVLAAGLSSRVTFVGELGEAGLAAAYDRADAFVLATRHEGYGMAIAEAVARGLPVVSTPTGAIPELVDAASGVLVPIDDVEALTQAIEVVMNDQARARLTEGARRRRDGLPTWRDAAGQMAAALTRSADHGIVQR